MAIACPIIITFRIENRLIPVAREALVYNVNYHFVWSVKYRRQVLVGDVAEQLRELHESIAQEWGFSPA